MGLPQKRDPKVFEDAIRTIQAAKAPVLKLFKDIQDGAKRMKRWHAEVLDLHYERDRLRLEQLHNNPTIKIESEKEHAVKITVLTYVRYTQEITEEEAEDAKISELWPE